MQDASLFFDWAWAEDEYATSSIVFTRSANPADPIWSWGPGQANSHPGRVVVSDEYGPFLESNATVMFDATSFTPGTWYWRLCNKSIYGEDDKCSLDAEVRSLIVVAKPPPPPPPACDDGKDNDLDGDTDWLEDFTCEDETGTTEGPLPQCADRIDNDRDGSSDLSDGQCKRQTDKLEAPDPLPTLTDRATKRYIRSALRRKFRGAYSYGSFKRIRRCMHVSPTRTKCRRVSWGIGDISYRGRATIWLDNEPNGDAYWYYSFTIKRTNEYCVVRKRAGDRSYRGKRCSKIYRVR